MDPLTALLVLTLMGILLRQHALVQAGRLRAPQVPPGPLRCTASVSAGGEAAAAGEDASATTHEALQPRR